jgi:hypothetical protein
MYNRKHSEETKEKIRAARAKQVIHPRTEEQKEKMSQLQKERRGYGPKKHSKETLLKISQSLKGKPGHKKLLGVPKSEEWKQRISEGRLHGKKQENKTCPHCGKTNNPGNYNRWHGDKCKSKSTDAVATSHH